MKDVSELNKLPPIQNKYKAPKRSILNEENFIALVKRIDIIEKRLKTIDTGYNLQLIRKLRKQLNQIDGDLNGSNIRPKIDPK